MVSPYRLRSGGCVEETRSGSTRGARNAASAIVTTTIGTPTIEKEKNEKPEVPACWAAPATRTLTGDAVKMSRDPALPANAIGISMRAGGRPNRIAITITMGINAAAAPLSVIRALITAAIAITATSATLGRSPMTDSSQRPAQVVTPAESMPSLTTNSEAMKITTRSPNPDRASCTVSTPVA